jgi:ankyrin repeat protein
LFLARFSLPFSHEEANMKLLFRCILLVGWWAFTSVSVVADDNPPPAAVPPAPSEDTIRDFHLAVGAGDRREVASMIKAYPSLVSAKLPDEDGNKQCPPVFTAIDHGQTQVLAILLNHAAQRFDDATHQTALDRATVFGTVDVVKLLLDSGENVDGLTDPSNLQELDRPTRGTPLRDAISNGHLQSARALLQHGAHIDIYSAAGLGWDKWVARRVKDHPEEIDMVDDWRYTPLVYTVAGSCSGTAEILLTHGADVARTFDDGGTLLHLATLYGHHDVIATLLAHGADVNAKNKAGETSLDYAIKYNQQDAADFLKEHGAKRGADMPN